MKSIVWSFVQTVLVQIIASKTAFQKAHVMTVENPTAPSYTKALTSSLDVQKQKKKYESDQCLDCCKEHRLDLHRS
jgi:hypothetical protein